MKENLAQKPAVQFDSVVGLAIYQLTNAVELRLHETFLKKKNENFNR